MCAVNGTDSSGKLLTVSGLIREYISSRNLRPGDRLPRHEDLAKELGIGLRRLREGLSVLRDQGIVHTRRKGGTLVTNSSVEHFAESVNWHLEDLGCSFENLLRARAVIQAAAGVEAAIYRTDENLEMLDKNLSQMSKAKSRDFADIDKRFHSTMLECTQNPVIRLFGELLESQLEIKKPTLTSRIPKEHMEHEIDDHHQIHRAIVQKKPATTAKACYRHVLRNKVEEGTIT